MDDFFCSARKHDFFSHFLKGYFSKSKKYKNKEYILYVARFFVLHCCPKATVYGLRGTRGNAKKRSSKMKNLFQILCLMSATLFRIKCGTNKLEFRRQLFNSDDNGNASGCEFI